MSRTTLSIDDDLLEQLKAVAAKKKLTVGAVVNDMLRHAIAEVATKPHFELTLKGWKAEAQPGVDILDRDKLFDLMDGR